MRKAFIDTVCSLAEVDQRVVLLTGDLGYMVMEGYRQRFPDRFFNVGVAEQNMIGIATGLAEAGFLPYAYSIATFAALRPFEFIRNGPVAHHVPVRVVGMGMGFEYGHDGQTHHALEDVGVLRTLPGLTIVIPADSAQARSAVRDTAGLADPVYYSLAKDDTLNVRDLDGRFALGHAQVVRAGTDLAILSMGSVTVEAAAAADALAAEGIRAAVAVVSNFHPDPDEDVAALLRTVPHAITVEAQTISGGLAAYVATVIASRGLHCRLWPLAVRTSPDGTSGSQLDRWRKHGLDRLRIAQTARQALRRHRD
jgi:transketolase